MTLVDALPNHLDKDIKDSFDMMSNMMMKESLCQKIFNTYDTSEWVESWTSDEGFDDFQEITESQALPETNIREGYKISLEAKQFALALIISLKMRERAMDDTVKLAKLIAPKNVKLIRSARNKIETYTHELLDNAFGTTLVADSQPLIGTHTWKTTGNTFTNRVSGDPEFGAAAWDDVHEYAGDLEDATGKKMDFRPNQLIVKRGSDAERAAIRLFDTGKRLYADAVTGINIYEGSGVEVIATPYLSSKKAWFARDKSMENTMCLKFITRPRLHEMQKRENLDFFYPATFTMEAGARNIGIDWIGSNPA